MKLSFTHAAGAAALCLSLSLLLGSPQGAAAAPTSQPAEILAGKGLNKSGVMYILAADKEIAEGMRKVALAKSKMDADNKARLALETKIKQVKAAISQADFERRQLNDRLSKVTDVTQNNQIIGKINVISSKIEEALAYKEEQDKALQALGDGSRTDYVNLILDLNGKAEAAAKEYAALAADADVTAALASVKGRLGPSPDFTTQTGNLKRLRGMVTSDVIKLKMEGGIPWADVTINGVTRQMVVDSGASLLAIPADMAKALELVPARDAPVLRLQLADGKLVEARGMTLKTVRVGTFTAENVEAAILPADLVSAQPLLGNSFLGNFIYKLNPEAAELHLSQIGGKPAAPAPK